MDLIWNTGTQERRASVAHRCSQICSRSAWGPVEFAFSQEVHVQVRHGFSGIGAIVHHESKTILKE